MGYFQTRALFISDTHLGLSDPGHIDKLSDFLKENPPEYLYLVGDIIDGWRLKRRWYWPAAYNRFLKRVMKLDKNGTKVFYLPGNHDEFLREMLEINLGGIQIQDEVVHTSQSGNTYLVMHGDQFDVVILHGKWLSKLGAVGYEVLLRLNRWIGRARRILKRESHWSLADAVKQKVKGVVKMVNRYEKALVGYAHEKGHAGVVCGHIHRAAVTEYPVDGGMCLYLNCGDMVESGTFLEETSEGQVRLHKIIPTPAMGTLQTAETLGEL